jgi:hypothetical protein
MLSHQGVFANLLFCKWGRRISLRDIRKACALDVELVVVFFTQRCRCRHNANDFLRRIDNTEEIYV